MRQLEFSGVILEIEEGNFMESTVKLRYIRQSASKIRFVLKQVNGMRVSNALDKLTYSNKKAGNFISKAINSAVANLLSENENVELVREPSLSCVLFRRKGWTPEDYRNWTYKNHRDGFALVTPTKWRTGDTFETVARFCFINPDTTEADITAILDSMNLS